MGESQFPSQISRTLTPFCFNQHLNVLENLYDQKPYSTTPMSFVTTFVSNQNDPECGFLI